LFGGFGLLEQNEMIGIATLLTVGLMKYYELSEMYYGILFTMFNWALREWNWWYHYDCLCVIIMICWILYYSNADKVRYKMTIYDLNDMYRFLTSVFVNNKYYTHHTDAMSFRENKQDPGNSLSHNRWYDYGHKVYFKDESSGVYGFYQWKHKKITISYQPKKSQKYEKEHNQDYIELSIVESKCDIREYFKNVIKNDRMVAQPYSLSNYITFGSVCKAMSCHISSEKYDIDRHIGSFFHKQKKNILMKINTMQNDPIAMCKLGFKARVQMIFHGPSGTGKSSFCHIIAQKFSRHIFEFNLKNYLINKRRLYQLLANDWASNWCKPNQRVIILHGLDAVVDRIYMTNGCHNGELTFNDLVELFNNQMFNDGTVVIITTDKFDEMNAKCPELFRYGRIQPVKFDYADDWFLKKLTKYYYKTTTSINITKRNIAPCVLINMVMQSKAQNNRDEFDYFEQALNEYLKMT